MLGLKETLLVVQKAKVNGLSEMVRACFDEEYDDGHVLRNVLEFEVKGNARGSEDDQRRRGRCKWRRRARVLVWGRRMP